MNITALESAACAFLPAALARLGLSRALVNSGKRPRPKASRGQFKKVQTGRCACDGNVQVFLGTRQSSLWGRRFLGNSPSSRPSREPMRFSVSLAVFSKLDTPKLDKFSPDWPGQRRGEALFGYRVGQWPAGIRGTPRRFSRRLLSRQA